VIPLLYHISQHNILTLPLSIITSQIILVAWASRLSLFLVYRASVLMHDARLDDTLSKVSGMFGFWFISNLWGIACALPHTLSYIKIKECAVNRRVITADFRMQALITLGVVVSVVGLCVEVLSDYQKWDFKQTHQSDEFVNTGLWYYSQHPNYAGNILIFVGIYIININTSPKLLSLLSPVFITALLYTQAIGAFPGSGFAVAYEQSVRKYGMDYVHYCENTGTVFPNLF
jgi:steroid 5-alpha reductase family enzyme